MRAKSLSPIRKKILKRSRSLRDKKYKKTRNSPTATLIYDSEDEKEKFYEPINLRREKLRIYRQNAEKKRQKDIEKFKKDYPDLDPDEYISKIQKSRSGILYWKVRAVDLYDD
jgi:hypothetical protein